MKASGNETLNMGPYYGKLYGVMDPPHLQRRLPYYLLILRRKEEGQTSPLSFLVRDYEKACPRRSQSVRKAVFS